MNITLDFYVDRPYLKDVNHDEVRLAKKTGRPLDKFLVQQPRSIFAMLNYGGKLFKFKTGEKIYPRQFDYNLNRVKKNVPGSFEWNIMLENFKSNIQKALMNARIEGRITTHQDIRDIVNEALYSKLPVKSNKSLLGYYDDWVKEKSLQLKIGTVKKYNSLKTWLEKFQKHFGKTLYCESIDRGFDIDFRLLLINAGLLNGSIQKYYATFKAFMNWSLEKGIHNNTEFTRFKSERTVSDIIYLTQNEIDAMYNLDLSDKPGQERVRDIFIWQTMTGQRFSDIKNARYEDFKISDEGIEWHLYQIKGNKDTKVIVPLSKRAIEIFNKIGRKEGYLFHCNSDQVTNRMLKTIAKLAGITDPISQVKYSGKKRIEITKPKYEFVSTHCARRTFTTLSLEKNLRPEIIMKVTGHQNYQTMKLYMKLVDTVVKKEMLDAWDE